MTVVGSKRMAIYDDTAPDKLQVFDRAVLPTNGDLLYHHGETTSIPLDSVEPPALARRAGPQSG